ncbi:DUF2599 domain-containing protein [Cellulomonas sp. RIT-PI-Y]|uniref:DUF2599 domain-containing protein n=1 Tax=Cellulomonas sp. RIT-PI-Y TaxID=3035297 RepID=UPI0021DAA4A0|nr:DUF2599 domain-containing protein [Cellulomonas sp. RIT-PI-Y]
MRRLPIALLAGLLLLAGCTPGTGDPVPTAVATADTTADVPAATTDAAGVRATGTPLTVGDLTLVLSPAPVDPTVDEEGATTVEVGGTVSAAPPEGDSAEPLGDGGVLLRDVAGVAVAGIDADGATSTVAADGLIVFTPTTELSTVTLTVATVAVRSATWADIDDEGGRSLAVVPSTWARGGGLAVDALLWAQLIAAQPEADSQTMHDQLTCHQIGAPDKESWNLEPWRPEVGLVQTLLARCNPE